MIQLPVLELDRRTFISQTLKGLGIAVCGSALVSALESCESHTTKVSTAPPDPDSIVEFDTSSDAKLKIVGGGLQTVLKDTKGTPFNNDKGVLIIRTKTDGGGISDEPFIVLSAICDHAQCWVDEPATPGADLVCPCHGSSFSQKDGAKIQGLATNGLKKFKTKYDSTTKLLKIFV